MLTNDGSSKNVTLRLNFSGTPAGGTGEFSGHVMSFISNPSSVHTPIFESSVIHVHLMIYNYFFPISQVVQVDDVQLHKLQGTIWFEFDVWSVVILGLLDTNITKIPERDMSS